MKDITDLFRNYTDCVHKTEMNGKAALIAVEDLQMLAAKFNSADQELKVAEDLLTRRLRKELYERRKIIDIGSRLVAEGEVDEAYFHLLAEMAEHLDRDVLTGTDKVFDNYASLLDEKGQPRVGVMIIGETTYHSPAKSDAQLEEELKQAKDDLTSALRRELYNFNKELETASRVLAEGKLAEAYDLITCRAEPVSDQPEPVPKKKFALETDRHEKGGLFLVEAVVQPREAYARGLSLEQSGYMSVTFVYDMFTDLAVETSATPEHNVLFEPGEASPELPGVLERLLPGEIYVLCKGVWALQSYTMDRLPAEEFSPLTSQMNAAYAAEREYELSKKKLERSRDQIARLVSDDNGGFGRYRKD